MQEFLKSASIEKGPFSPTWDSLRQFKCPDWFRDAKLGIWAHWGPQSVPMYGDWYARNMYIPGESQYHHHWRMYGHPSKHGYKDIAKLWKAERFDPEGLMKLFVDAGAKYFVAQAVHHDNFDNWDSKHNKWNSAHVGPMKNIVGLWQQAAKKCGLRFGLSEHLGASFSWWRYNKLADKTGPYAGVPYDGNDPAYEDLYHPNKSEPENAPWMSTNPWWAEQWFKRIKDLVDQHQPDLLYSDSGLPFGDVGLNLVAHLYNTSAKLHGGVNEAVYNHKDAAPDVAAIAVLDIERGQMNQATPFVWQTDTSVGDWYYNVRDVYKTPEHVIEMFVDMVSKNGNLLLNFTQKPDGTFDEETLYILKSMAAWIKVNGEGIYGTRPWKVAGEGPGGIEAGAFKEKAVPWTTTDFRFTAKGSVVYAFQMRYPEQRQAFIRSLGRASGVKVKSVQVLGATQPVQHVQAEDGLLVHLPTEKVCEMVPCIKVEIA